MRLPVDLVPREEAPPSATPSWLITYADLVTLLLACFIMLAGMSELKPTSSYQTLLKSMRQKFGADHGGRWFGSRASPKLALAQIAWRARTRRQQLLGLDRPWSPPATLRLTIAAGPGGLSGEQQQSLLQFAEAIEGQDGPLEVATFAGAAEREVAPVARLALADANRRAEIVVAGLIEQGIDPRRIRVQALLSSSPSSSDRAAGRSEPSLAPTADATGTVEVRLLGGPSHRAPP